MIFKYFISVVFLIQLWSCKNQNKEVELVENVSTESKTSNRELDIADLENIELKVYDYEGFKLYLEKMDNKIRVINFWATWCAPCVKELPYFEKLNQQYKNHNVEVILVSLDFPHLYEKKLKPFIVKNKLQSEVIALDDPDMNSWIPKVSEGWSGSIPATIIYKNDQRQFYEQSFTYEELEKELKQFLN